MSVLFGGVTYVSDTVSDNFYGESHFIEGDIEDEIFERSIVRSHGVLEVSGGNRWAIHQVLLTYHTQSETTVRAALRSLRLAKQYATLTVQTTSGSTFTGSMSYDYCRLASVLYGPRQAGFCNGQHVVVLPAVLIFKQVRLPAS